MLNVTIINITVINLQINVLHSLTSVCFKNITKIFNDRDDSFVIDDSICLPTNIKMALSLTEIILLVKSTFLIPLINREI